MARRTQETPEIILDLELELEQGQEPTPQSADHPGTQPKDRLWLQLAQVLSEGEG